MEATRFTIELDGQRVLVDQAGQCVTLLDAAGTRASSETIQVAAGSLQGIFSMLEGVTGVKHV